MRAMFLAVVLLASGCRGEESVTAVKDKAEPKPKKAPKKAPEKLAEPLKHRATAEACSRVDAPATTSTHAKQAPGTPCLTATDCGFLSRCVGGHCRTDQCYADSDCKSEKSVCACDPMNHGHRCLPSDCQVDADCGPGGFCSPSFGLQCGSYHGVLSYHCHTPKDDCLNDSDCRKESSSYGYCAFEPKSGHWICGTAECDG